MQRSVFNNDDDDDDVVAIAVAAAAAADDDGRWMITISRNHRIVSNSDTPGHTQAVVDSSV